MGKEQDQEGTEHRSVVGETLREKREGSCFEVLGGSCLNSSILEETETDYTLYIDENLLRDLGVPLS